MWICKSCNRSFEEFPDHFKCPYCEGKKFTFVVGEKANGRL